MLIRNFRALSEFLFYSSQRDVRRSPALSKHPPASWCVLSAPPHTYHFRSIFEHQDTIDLGPYAYLSPAIPDPHPPPPGKYPWRGWSGKTRMHIPRDALLKKLAH
ncbi:hypothetical protein Y032_0004g2076 [Ancylostoma ceylanicum]|uniref:Uncharacterized protein n=1 Tax=Ancylostoma ceylanicum TaxID=53326 RepID=A0A016VUK7_9BILA|nr:hypothetical protein Y032_0004g2076 [Ancylostoma ceylanicum]